MSKKRGRSKQRPVQVQAVPEEVLAEGSGPVADEQASIELAADLAMAEVVAGLETPADPELETTAVDDGEVPMGGEPIETAAEAVADEAVESEAVEGELAADGEVVEGELAADGEPVDGELAADGEPVDGELAADGDAATLPTSAAAMDAVTLKQLVEALVFAADKPITVQRLRQLTRVSDVKRLEEALVEITADYAERGLVLQQVSGGYQFRTRPQFSAWVQQLIAGRPVRLSRAQLETLAIVAYRQPITRPEIDDIRGVDSSATLKLLMDRLLIRVLGKKEEVGRPMLYGTTREFLDFFSLGDLRELPTLREYSELSDESRKVMSSRLGIGLDGSGGEGGNEGGGNDGGGDDGGGDGGDDGGSSGSGGGGGGGEGGGPILGDLDGGEGDSSGRDEISASSLSDLASKVLAHEDVTNELAMLEAEPAADEPASDETAMADAPMTSDRQAMSDEEPSMASDDQSMSDDAVMSDEASMASDGADEASMASDGADEPSMAETSMSGDETISVDAETMVVDAETRQVAPIVVEHADEDAETRDMDPVTETMTLADAPELERSETRIVDPLIAAEVLAHAETIVSSGESPE